PSGTKVVQSKAGPGPKAGRLPPRTMARTAGQGTRFQGAVPPRSRRQQKRWGSDTTAPACAAHTERGTGRLQPGDEVLRKGTGAPLPSSLVYGNPRRSQGKIREFSMPL